MKRLIAEVDDELYQAVKIKAIRQGKTMREVIVELVQKWLAEDEQKREKGSRK